MSNPRQTAQELIAVLFTVAHAQRLNPSAFDTKQHLNDFIDRQLKEAGYEVEFDVSGTSAILKLESPKP